MKIKNEWHLIRQLLMKIGDGKKASEILGRNPSYIASMAAGKDYNVRTLFKLLTAAGQNITINDVVATEKTFSGLIVLLTEKQLTEISEDLGISISTLSQYRTMKQQMLISRAFHIANMYGLEIGLQNIINL